MHIFVALLLPNTLKELLAHAQKPIDGIRWQPARQMHITLKFLGEISEKKVWELKTKLEKIAQFRFTLRVQGWGTFPQKGQPKIIWAGVKPVDSIHQLRTSIEEYCASFGLQKDNHSFVPHITIGRIKRNYTKQQLGNIMGDFRMVSKEFTVKSFAIYESLPTSDGAIHKVIKKYPLPKKKNDNGYQW